MQSAACLLCAVLGTRVLADPCQTLVEARRSLAESAPRQPPPDPDARSLANGMAETVLAPRIEEVIARAEVGGEVRAIRIPADAEIIASPQLGDFFEVRRDGQVQVLQVLEAHGDSGSPERSISVQVVGGAVGPRFELSMQEFHALAPRVAPEVTGGPGSSRARSRTLAAHLANLDAAHAALSGATELPPRLRITLPGGGGWAFSSMLTSAQQRTLELHRSYAIISAQYLRATGVPCDVVQAPEGNSYRVIILPAENNLRMKNRPWLTRLASSLDDQFHEALFFDTASVPAASGQFGAFYLPGVGVALPVEDMHNPVISLGGTHELRHQQAHHSRRLPPTFRFSGRSFQESPLRSSNHTEALNRLYQNHHSDEVSATLLEMSRSYQAVIRARRQAESATQQVGIRRSIDQVYDRGQYLTGFLSYQNQTLDTLIHAMQTLPPASVAQQITVLLHVRSPTGVWVEELTSLQDLPQRVRAGARVQNSLTAIEIEFQSPDASRGLEVPPVARVHFNPAQLARDEGSPLRAQFFREEAQNGRAIRQPVQSPQVGDMFEWRIGRGGVTVREWVEVVSVQGRQLVLRTLGTQGNSPQGAGLEFSIPHSQFLAREPVSRILPERMTAHDLLVELRYLRWQNQRALQDVLRMLADVATTAEANANQE